MRRQIMGIQGIQIFVALLGLAFGACIHRPEVKPETFTLHDAYVSTQDTARTPEAQAQQPALPPESWWQLFADPTLDALVETATRESPDLEQMRARVDQAQANLKFAVGGLLPTLRGEAVAGRQKRILSDQIQFETNQFSLSLAAGYEFNLGGRDLYAKDAATYEVEAATLRLAAARISLIANVVEAYFVTVALRAQRALLDQTIESRSAQLALVHRRYRQGLATPLDVYQAQENLAMARGQHAENTSNLGRAETALATVVGRHPGQVSTGALAALPAALTELPLGVPGELLWRRPDVQAGFAQLRAFDERVGEALAQHLPTLSLGGTIGQNFDPTGFVWSVLAQLTAPLFQGGKIRAQYLLRKGVLREQTAAFRAVLLQAVREVEDAVIIGRASDERLQWLAQRVTAADSALRLAIDQYLQGLVDYLQILTLERNLYSARVEQIIARAQLLSARVQLIRALGGGWRKEDSDA